MDNDFIEMVYSYCAKGGRLLFWTCPNKCNDFVDWLENKATCRKCGATNNKQQEGEVDNEQTLDCMDCYGNESNEVNNEDVEWEHYCLIAGRSIYREEGREHPEWCPLAKLNKEEGDNNNNET